jgi:hypothetical protein
MLYDWLFYYNWRFRIYEISKTELIRINIDPGDQVYGYMTGTETLIPVGLVYYRPRQANRDLSFSFPSRNM